MHESETPIRLRRIVFSTTAALVPIVLGVFGLLEPIDAAALAIGLVTLVAFF